MWCEEEQSIINSAFPLTGVGLVSASVGNMQSQCENQCYKINAIIISYSP